MLRYLSRISARKKTRLEVRNPRLSPVIDVFEKDEPATYLPGSPGYRVARGRSGLGFFATQAELGRFQGIVIRSLFTGKFLYTNNLIAMIGLILTAVFMGGIPLALISADLIFDQNRLPILLMFTDIQLVVNLVFGMAILLTAVVNIIKLSTR
jgi:hypothetical protein